VKKDELLLLDASAATLPSKKVYKRQNKLIYFINEIILFMVAMVQLAVHLFLQKAFKLSPLPLSYFLCYNVLYQSHDW
jgi:hypothetical protein